MIMMIFNFLMMVFLFFTGLTLFLCGIGYLIVAYQCLKDYIEVKDKWLLIFFILFLLVGLVCVLAPMIFIFLI